MRCCLWHLQTKPFHITSLAKHPEGRTGRTPLGTRRHPYFLLRFPSDEHAAANAREPSRVFPDLPAPLATGQGSSTYTHRDQITDAFLASPGTRLDEPAARPSPLERRTAADVGGQDDGRERRSKWQQQPAVTQEDGAHKPA